MAHSIAMFDRMYSGMYKTDIAIRNSMGGTATIRLTHRYDGEHWYQPEQYTWENIGSGQTTDYFRVHYDHWQDTWWVKIFVKDGAYKGVYICASKDLELKGDDGDASCIFEITPTTFYVNTKNNPDKFSMVKLDQGTYEEDLL